MCESPFENHWAKGLEVRLFNILCGRSALAQEMLDLISVTIWDFHHQIRVRCGRKVPQLWLSKLLAANKIWHVKWELWNYIQEKPWSAGTVSDFTGNCGHLRKTKTHHISWTWRSMFIPGFNWSFTLIVWSTNWILAFIMQKNIGDQSHWRPITLSLCFSQTQKRSDKQNITLL